MKICPACHQQILCLGDKDKFCPYCGHVLVEKVYPNCASCGAMMLDSFQFCGGCGRSREEALHAPTANPK